MSFRAVGIILILAFVVLVITNIFPYQKLNISHKGVTIIRVIASAVVLGIAVRYIMFSL